MRVVGPKEPHPLGLPRDFVVQAAAAIADLIVDALDLSSLLEDRVRLRQRDDADSVEKSENLVTTARERNTIKHHRFGHKSRLWGHRGHESQNANCVPTTRVDDVNSHLPRKCHLNAR